MKILFVAILLLSGCGFTSEGTLLRQTVKEQGAKAADEGMRNAIWFLCEGQTIGAIRRWVGGDAKKAKAYNTICEREAPASVILGN